mmetsp:Transcript_2912/g.5393  ORF Transcript_2912/g.5393 Transcript_2912/m.5393 type:complete len:90 (+) Transcript_2912:732-1001(+)
MGLHEIKYGSDDVGGFRGGVSRENDPPMGKRTDPPHVAHAMLSIFAGKIAVTVTVTVAVTVTVTVNRCNASRNLNPVADTHILNSYSLA